VGTRSFFFGAIALAAAFPLADAASAADAPRAGYGAADEVRIAPFDWSGFYAGLHGGAGWGEQSFSVPGFLLINWEASGAFGGAHAGYNVQSGAFVFGLQTEINAAGINGDILNGTDPLFDEFYTGDVRWFGSVDARLGVAVNRTLLYAIGGYAFGNIRHTVEFRGLPGSRVTFSDTYHGWNLGAGVEQALGANWTGRIEYRYYDFGNVSHAAGVSPVTGPFPAHNHDFTMQTVRIGVSKPL